MLRFLLCLAILLNAIIPPSQALAANSDEGMEHVRSAFLFASRKDWTNALLHARHSENIICTKLITWEYLLDQDSGASFSDIADFIDKNPKWPDQKKLHLRAEMALKNGNFSDQDIVEWFGKTTPVSGIGKIALAEALQRTKSAKADKINELIRDAWREGDFDEPQEKKIMDMHDDVLKRDDYIVRINRLLWEERIAPAKRILNRVTDTYQKLFKARIALIDNKRLSSFAVMQVSSALKNDPGLIYDRMRYRARHDDDSGVRDMLELAPAEPPYPEKWWHYREIQVRKAIDEKKYSLAKKLLANHGQAEGSNQSDALWLQSWLALEFMDKPKEAYDGFYAMYSKVRYTVSKARAAYWTARAAEKSGDRETAESWYKTAASYPTTFYGQLASLKLNGTAPIHIPSPPSISNQDKRDFENNEVAQAIKLSIKMDDLSLASHMIALVVENSDDDSEVALFSQIGLEMGNKYLSVHAAKKASKQNVVLLSAGYPTPHTASGLPIERVLTLAIVRQESEFDPGARSPSNAVGMMQLLPGTAKEVARKHGIAYSPKRLLEPDYNMTLGSYYLGRLISSYDGSYIMAIAAYNAGPGNVRNWVQEFGTPNNDVDNAVNWIEKIPFSETRNYVQRVMENLQVYRYIDAEDEAPKLKLGEDLVR